MHKFIPSFSFKGTVTKPRPSSSRVVIPCLSSAVLRDCSYQPGRAYHSTHEDRRDSAATSHEERWDTNQPGARQEILVDLFPDLEDWDFLNGCSPDAVVRNAFVILRMVATVRYLHLKSQELHEALMSAHEIIGDAVKEKVYL
jgi:hypothetical protein